MNNQSLTLDNSAFNLLYCPRRFQLAIIQGLRGADSSTAGFGNTFHTAVEVLDKTSDVNTAFAAVLDKGMKCDELKLIEALTALKFTIRLPPALVMSDEKPGIEVKFKYFYTTTITPFGNLDIYLAGTLDRCHISEDGYLEFVDYKTASDFKPISQQTKIEEYENSFQLPFYVYSAVKSGILPLHAIELYNTGRYRTKYIFIFYSNQPCRIVQQEFEAYKSDFFEGRFKTTLEHHVKSAVNIWSESQSNITSPYSGMNTYKGCVYCPYRPGCVTKNTEQEELFLSRFPRISYDPLTFR